LRIIASTTEFPVHSVLLVSAPLYLIQKARTLGLLVGASLDLPYVSASIDTKVNPCRWLMS
jgi:hypothetical protein